LRRQSPATRWQSALLALAALGGCGRAPDRFRTVLTSVSQVRRISAAQVRLGVPVRIRGILTYFDGISSYCFIQDATGGMRISLAPGQNPPANGWRVEITGVVSSAGAAPAVVEARVSALGPDTLPPAVPVSTAGLKNPEYEYKRVVISGVVQSVSSERPGLMTLEIRAGSATVWAKVPASITVVNDEWIDAEVRGSGVLAESSEGNPAGAGTTVWVSDSSAIEVTRPATPLAALPVTKIGSLLALNPARPPPHRVRTRGVPYAPVQGGLAIMDDADQIAVRIGGFAPDPNARVLEVAGFLRWEHGHPMLDEAVLVDGVEAADRGHAPASGFTLTTARAIHQLPASASQQGYAVHLRAVVTYFDPGNHLLFVQERTDGVFVQTNGIEKLSLRAGDEVEVTGVTLASFAPDVGAARIRIIGHAGLPAPKAARFESANWGREDCRWLELGGIVEHVAQGTGDTLLTLSWGKATYSAHVLAPPGALAHLLDAEVKLRGVCGAIYNAKRQMLGIQIYVPESECIRVVRAASSDPFSMAATPIADLLQFSRTRNMGHRVRIQGTVTYPNRSGPTWIRDSTGGVMIQDHEPAPLAAGDLVDVVGFPEIAGFGPALRGAQMRRLQSGAPPAPVRVTAGQAIKGDFDGQLVQMEGTLIDQLQLPARQVLAVASGEMIFNADLPVRGAARPMESGTRLRLTGICSVAAEQSYDLIPPLTFRILLRSPADIEIVGRPPWLTADRVVPFLAGAALLAIAALAWAGLLRRRVRAQTFALRAQTVQLHAAHQRTRDALRKTCEAESLELDGKRILELIARDEPVDLILDHVAEAVALHCEGAVCAILLGTPQDTRVTVVPPMPAGWLDALGRLGMGSISFSPELRAPRQFSDASQWTDFVDSQRNARFRTCCSAPIVVEGATAGAIAAFFRDEKRPAIKPADHAAPGAQLDLWCNMAALALERRRLHDQLSYRAQYDGLTGLPNRALLYDRLEAEIARAARGGGMLGVLYVDLDGFKQINDTHGHDAGDAVLREAARRMTNSVRRGDTVGRIGGDEFVVLLPLLSHRADAEQIADKIAQALRESIYSNRQPLAVSACVGIAIWPLDGDKPDPLLRFADAQMYGQKRRRWYDAPATPESEPVTPGR
jgi:diguanylate cyclase (GGDEF)-like protein